MSSGAADGWVRGRDYRRGNRLGSGGYGVVFECINMNPTPRKEGVQLNRGALFAEKVVELACDRGSVDELRNEVEVLSSLQHPHIVRYYGSYISGKERYRLHLFMEFVPGGSLHDIVIQFGRLSEAVIQTYTEQILQALQYLHSEGYIHRDLKASNILINTSSVVKVGDFGTCHRMENLRTQKHEIEHSQVGTPSFFPPERILEKKIGPQTDIWALGCVILEMVNGYRPFRNAENLYQIGYRLSSGELPSEEVPGTSSEDLRKFVTKCCERDPEKRPLANELLNDRFIKMEIGSESTSDCGYSSDITESDRMTMATTETMTISTLNYYNSSRVVGGGGGGGGHSYNQHQGNQLVPAAPRHLQQQQQPQQQQQQHHQPKHHHHHHHHKLVGFRPRKYFPSFRACVNGFAIAAGASFVHAKGFVSKLLSPSKRIQAITDQPVNLSHGHTATRQNALVRGCVWLVGVTTPPPELATFLAGRHQRNGECDPNTRDVCSVLRYMFRKRGKKVVKKLFIFTFLTALIAVLYELILLIREKRKLLKHLQSETVISSPRFRPTCANMRIIQRYLRVKTGGKVIEG
eukprot:TRINITY_DN979_c1_g1_i1.p1 TRINITY_DN979_c1_g1~~TRINITY_DN979_c1_g1_i1.p1  ORF type:complete len:577 (+),score=119.27 TRINITY_DN979_c1_g1_i1:53-1783(+)